MSKAISLTIETQTEEREVLSVCHINERMIALETSFVAGKMLKLNRSLFDKINETTKMIGGTLYRQEITEVNGGRNNLYVPVGNSYESREVDIARLFFEGNILKKQQRAISKYGKKFDFDPALVSSDNTGGYFDIKKLSPDDIAASSIVSTVEEIYLFQDEGIKSILITDNLEKTKSLIEVGYRIELAISTDFDEYIKFVLDLARKSIKFLTIYLNSLSYSNNYNAEAMEFDPNYTSNMMRSLGLSTDLASANLSNSVTKSSEFGQAAISYYNLASLLSPDINKNVYSSVLRAILPTNKTTPDAISSFVNNFTSLLNRAMFEYTNKPITGGPSKKYSRVSKGQVNTDTLQAVSKESLSIEQERLGYAVFSDSTGLNLFSSEDYKKRWALERAKYYPRVGVEDVSHFMTPSEKGRFANLGNAASYLTPTSMIMGDTTIRTNRGVNNVNVDEVRQFRLAKSIRYSQQRSNRFPQSVQKNSISLDSLGALNVTIAAPKDALLNRSTSQEIDPLIDSKHYIGDSSFTTNHTLDLIKSFRRILSSKDKRILSITSDIVPNTLLRNNLAINSIKDIQISNPESLLRKQVVEESLDIEDLPPHVKFMMSADFNPNPNSDPLKNSESRQLILETQANIYVIMGLTGFGLYPNGFFNVHDPIYKKMHKLNLPTGASVLAKAYNYEVPELGILKDNFLAPIYNNLCYIRG